MKVLKHISVIVIVILFSGNLYAQKDQPKRAPKWLDKKCQDTITVLNDSINSLNTINTELKKEISNFKKQINLQKEEIDKFKVDIFLNIEDTSIFTSSFLELNTVEIHPSRRNYYLLIENIFDLNILLSPDGNGDIIAQLSRIKSNLDKASQTITTINSFNEFEYLSETQKIFFRRLVLRFNELTRTFNPQGN